MSTRTVPHPRWPGVRLSPRDRRVIREGRRFIVELGLCTARLEAGAAEMRASFQALADEQRRANAVAAMEGDAAGFARREAFVRETVARQAAEGSPE